MTTKRIALCLYGQFNNRLDKSSGTNGFQYIKGKLLNKFDLDVFIDTTDIANAKVIQDLYGPWIRNADFRPSSDYKDLLNRNSVSEDDFKARDGFRTLSNTLAFLESRSRSIRLMSDYASRAGAYDAVITCRFDLGQLDKVNGRQNFHVSEIGFSPEHDMNYIYSAQWDQHNAGYADQWFYSNQTNIEILGDMFDISVSYFTPGSEFLNWLSSGITDSKENDEFSNMRLKRDASGSGNLVKRPINTAVDNHLLHKYYFLRRGLYEISRFAVDLHGIASVTYSHTDCVDVWPIKFGETAKFLGYHETNYLLVNSLTPAIPSYLVPIIYDDSLKYTDRLKATLELVKSEFILFEHEDMFLYGMPKLGPLLEFFDEKMDRNEGLDYIRLIRGGAYFGVPYLKHRGFSRLVNGLSPWIFSIQPSVWRTSALLALVSEAPGLNIWEFEVRAQSLIRKMKIRSATINQKSTKRGRHHWDSKIYPYVATAIVKGKWNFSEYPTELNSVTSEYGVDARVRGVI